METTTKHRFWKSVLDITDRALAPVSQRQFRIDLTVLHPRAQAAEGHIYTAIVTMFNRVKADVVRLAEKRKSALDKADSNDDQEKLLEEEAIIAAQHEAERLAEEITPSLQEAASGGVQEGVAQLELTDSGLINSINSIARDWARDRAAELVGMKYDDAGNLIQNPNAEWAITETTRDDLRRIVRQAFEGETPMADLISAIQESGVFSEARAKIIATTEVAFAQNTGNYEVWQNSGVRMRVKWLLSEDHVDDGNDPDCEDNDGEVVDLGEAFSSGNRFPPAHPNACFSGHSFAPYGDLIQILTAEYNGPAITLEIEIVQNDAKSASRDTSLFPDTETGNVLPEQTDSEIDLSLIERRGLSGGIGTGRINITIGPNHPVLTRRGFIKAGELSEGDELIYDSRMKVPTASTGESNFEKMHIFEDAFDSLRIGSSASLVAAPSSYFHGDEIFTYGEVEVIRPTGNLLPKLDPGGIEEFLELPFPGTDPNSFDEARIGNFEAMFESLLRSPDSGMSSGSHVGPGIGRLPLPPFFHRARIVSCHRTTFQGRAYDASTQHAIYNCGGIIVKNCECVVVGILDEE